MLRLFRHLLRVHDFACVFAWHANRQPSPARTVATCSGYAAVWLPRAGWGRDRRSNFFSARLARGQVDMGNGRLAGIKVHVEQFVAAWDQPT